MPSEHKWMNKCFSTSLSAVNASNGRMIQLKLSMVTLQPALVAEVLHSNEVDKVREAYDSVSVVRSVPPLLGACANRLLVDETFSLSGSGVVLHIAAPTLTFKC